MRQLYIKKYAQMASKDGYPLKMAIAGMSDQKSIAVDILKRLNITTTTLYMYINGDRTLKEPEERLLKIKNVEL